MKMYYLRYVVYQCMKSFLIIEQWRKEGLIGSTFYLKHSKKAQLSWTTSSTSFRLAVSTDQTRCHGFKI